MIFFNFFIKGKGQDIFDYIKTEIFHTAENIIKFKNKKIKKKLQHVTESSVYKEFLQIRKRI